LYVPPKVEEEYFRGRNTGSCLLDFQSIFKRINPPLENELLPYFNFESGYGEVWVISHAIKNPNCFCVIDEQLGRNVCEIFNLKLIGTVGMIGLMKGMNLFSAKKLLQIRETVRTCGFYLSEEMCKELDNV
jgi:predicted nucleic acid-binding protein